MSNNLFTELSVEQQEIAAGGNRVTVNLGGSLFIRRRETTLTFTNVDPIGGVILTESDTESQDINADASTGAVVSSTPNPDLTALPPALQGLFQLLIGGGVI